MTGISYGATVDCYENGIEGFSLHRMKAWSHQRNRNTKEARRGLTLLYASSPFSDVSAQNAKLGLTRLVRPDKVKRAIAGLPHVPYDKIWPPGLFKISASYRQ